METKLCTTCNRDKDTRMFRGKLTCGRHRQQILKFGKVRERTFADGNDYVDRYGHTEVIIYNKYCKEVARALIDIEDKEKEKIYDDLWIKEDGFRESYKQFIDDFPIVIKCYIHKYYMEKMENKIINLKRDEEISRGISESKLY